MQNIDRFFPNHSELEQRGIVDAREEILTINNMLVSMLADPEVPDMVKPLIWGEVRKDTLSQDQFQSFLNNKTGAADWLRNSFPEMVKVTFLNDDRKAKTPGLSKIGVYFEVNDGHIIVYPIGFNLPGGNVFKCAERGDLNGCRELTKTFVFFGPDAQFACAMPQDVLHALQGLRVELWEFINPHMPYLNETIHALRDMIDARLRYQAEASVLAPVLSLAVSALNDPAKRKDMGRWLRSEYLKDEMVFNHACKLLDIAINTGNDGVTVRYL